MVCVSEAVVRLHRRHEMQTIVTNVHGVLTVSHVQCMPHAVCAGSFGAACVGLL